MSITPARDLVSQVRLQRGLWIGLHPREPMPADLPPHSHLTLAYLGKEYYASEELAELVVSAAMIAAQRVADEFISLEAGVGGVARFRSTSKTEGDPLVLLIQHPAIREMRDRVISTLASLQIAVKPSFDFTPHLTLERLQPDITHCIPPVQRRTIGFDRVTVTCGEAQSVHSLERTSNR